MAAAELEIRPATEADDRQVLELLHASLGWLPNDDHASFFWWKHRENPFGVSPSWVAVDEERIAGFRTFLRWRFHIDGRTVDAVRAVDTATHPDYQGRGIFRRLTLRALGELEAAGVGFVFNTPNDQSRPGYLSMGWRPVRHMPVLARPRSLATLMTMSRARVPAEKWSLATSVGEPAYTLAEHPDLDDLLGRVRRIGGGVRTVQSRAYLAWRYGLPALSYRVVPVDGGGVVVFRLRQRGAATEATICELLQPEPDRAAARRAVRRVLRDTSADYAVVLDQPLVAGFVRLPVRGPTLVWRSLTEEAMPRPASWHLSLGDVELF